MSRDCTKDEGTHKTRLRKQKWSQIEEILSPILISYIFFGRKSIMISRRRKQKKTRKRQKPLVFGHVFSTQCGHCSSMQDDWTALCHEMRNKGTLIDIGDDYSNQVLHFNQTYKTNLEYDGFPTIFKFKNKIEYYNGERTKSKMKKWLLRN